MSRCASGMLSESERSMLRAILRNSFMKVTRIAPDIFIRPDSKAMTDTHLVVNLIYPYIEYWPARYLFRGIALRDNLPDDLTWSVYDFRVCKTAIRFWHEYARTCRPTRNRPYQTSFRRVLKTDDTPIFSGFCRW